MLTLTFGQESGESSQDLPYDREKQRVLENTIAFVASWCRVTSLEQVWRNGQTPKPDHPGVWPFHVAPGQTRVSSFRCTGPYPETLRADLFSRGN